MRDRLFEARWRSSWPWLRVALCRVLRQGEIRDAGQAEGHRPFAPLREVRTEWLVAPLQAEIFVRSSQLCALLDSRWPEPVHLQAIQAKANGDWNHSHVDEGPHRHRSARQAKDDLDEPPKAARRIAEGQREAGHDNDDHR